MSWVVRSLDWVRPTRRWVTISRVLISALRLSLQSRRLPDAWLPGSEPGILRRAEAQSRPTAKQILRLVVVGKVITSLWAVVFVSPLEAHEAYRYLFIGALVAVLFPLTGNSLARWFLVVVLLLGVVVFSFLAYALSNDANAMLTIVEMLALAGFLVASASMLTFLLLSSRVNRFYGT